MTHDTPPKRITLEEAQAAVDPRLVAEILRDFGTNFDGVYPVGVLARGVGPEQSMIGLAIKRGHLVTRSHADAMVAAALREAAIRPAPDAETSGPSVAGRGAAMTPAELTARGVRVKCIYAPDCDECGDTGWVYFSCGTPWCCKCQRKSRAALTTGENDD